MIRRVPAIFLLALAAALSAPALAPAMTGVVPRAAHHTAFAPVLPRVRDAKPPVLLARLDRPPRPRAARLQLRELRLRPTRVLRRRRPGARPAARLER